MRKILCQLLADTLVTDELVAFLVCSLSNIFIKFCCLQNSLGRHVCRSVKLAQPLNGFFGFLLSIDTLGTVVLLDKSSLQWEWVLKPGVSV